MDQHCIDLLNRVLLLNRPSRQTYDTHNEPTSCQAFVGDACPARIFVDELLAVAEEVAAEAKSSGAVVRRIVSTLAVTIAVDAGSSRVTFRRAGAGVDVGVGVSVGPDVSACVDVGVCLWCASLFFASRVATVQSVHESGYWRKKKREQSH